MGALSRLFFSRCPTKFKFVGSPAKPRGPGHEVSVSYVLTNGADDGLIKIHHVPGYMSELYLAEYTHREQFVLLDCGCPSDYTRLKYYMEDVLSKERGKMITMKRNLMLAVSSHCHVDHSGGASGYVTEHVPIARASHMETAYTSSRGKLHQCFECLVSIFVATRLGRAPENTFWYSKGLLGPYYPLPPAIQELGHGDPLPYGFDDWVAVKMPGHTTHMIGLYHKPSRIFYAADFMVKLKKGFFAPRPVEYSWAYLDTLRRLRTLDVRCLLLPHGGIVDVDQQYGSWDTILDNVAEHYRREHERRIPEKGAQTKMTVFLGHLISKILRSAPVESRKFTHADLDVAAMPQPLEKVNPFTILGK